VHIKRPCYWVSWFKKAVEQDEGNSQHDLGRCYEQSCGIRQNREKALELFRKSAAHLGQRNRYDGEEYELSCCSLKKFGDFYDRGDGGVRCDRVLALESWVKAASFNCKGAQFSCGQAYALGTDYPQDVPLGMQYLRSAAAQGYDDAIDLIHTMVEVVRGVRGKERCARSAQQVWVPRQMLAWRHPAAPHKLECPVAVAAAAATAPE
jgi:TPR repeat protein